MSDRYKIRDIGKANFVTLAVAGWQPGKGITQNWIMYWMYV